MQVLPFLLLVLVQVNLTEPGINKRYLSLSSRVIEFFHFGWNRFVSIEAGLTYHDLVLVIVCLLLASVVNRRQKMNIKLTKRIFELRVLAKQDGETVGKLSTILEDYRSKNTRLEMPLRRMHSQCEQMSSGISKQIKDLERITEKFQGFKFEWQRQAAHLVGTSERNLLENVENMKVKAELAMLKNFIELEFVKNACCYSKVLVDKAEDHVDRLLVSEGL